MRLFHLLLAWAERPTATSAAETRLHGRWLLLARLLWIAVALVTVALFVASLPVALDVWQRTTSISAADAQYLQAHGVSLSAWATFWVAETVLFALGWMGMGVFIFWRR